MTTNDHNSSCPQQTCPTNWPTCPTMSQYHVPVSCPNMSHPVHYALVLCSSQTQPVSKCQPDEWTVNLAFVTMPLGHTLHLLPKANYIMNMATLLCTMDAYTPCTHLLSHLIAITRNCHTPRFIIHFWSTISELFSHFEVNLNPFWAILGPCLDNF